jgi:hypothetical protein
VRLLAGSDPTGIRVEEKEEDHAERHEIHVDKEEYATVVEAPARLHAAECIHCAGRGSESGQCKERRGAVVGKVREEKSNPETDENECASTYQGGVTRIEKIDAHVTSYRLDLTRAS